MKKLITIALTLALLAMPACVGGSSGANRPAACNDALAKLENGLSGLDPIADKVEESNARGNRADLNKYGLEFQSKLGSLDQSAREVRRTCPLDSRNSFDGDVSSALARLRGSHDFIDHYRQR